MGNSVTWDKEAQIEPRAAAIPATLQRQDVLLAALLGLVVLLLRVPFQADLLDSFDAINYALALDHFDIRLAQPQAPGYPLYILLGRAFNLVFHDHRLALVWLSMISAGLGASAIYMVGHTMFNRRTGLVAAVLLAVSTVFWYMGEVAAPYALDLFLSALTGWLCYRLMTERSSHLPWLAALSLVLSGAVRPQTLFFLLPLFLWSLAARSWRTLLYGVLLVGAVFAAAFFPVVALSGGWQAFLQTMAGVLPIFRDTQAVLDALRIERFLANSITISHYTIRTVGELSLPFVLLGAARLLPGWRNWRRSRLLFLLVWLVPSWVFFLLVWPGNVGTILVSTPPLFLLAAAGFEGLISRPRWSTAGWAALFITAAWGVLVFTALPRYPFGERYRFFENYASLRSATAMYRDKLELVSQLPPERTIVFSDDFRHMQYYLPQYRTFSLPRFNGDEPEMVRGVMAVENGRTRILTGIPAAQLIPPGTRYIAFFRGGEEYETTPGVRAEMRKKGDTGILILEIPAGQHLQWTPHGLEPSNS